MTEIDKLNEKKTDETLNNNLIKLKQIKTIYPMMTN